MAYLPSVPDTNPASDTGIAGIARKVGKPGRMQRLGTVIGVPGAGSSTGTGGDPALHSLGHYGKEGSPLGVPLPGTAPPSSHSGSRLIQGGSIGRHVKKGGLSSSATRNYGMSN
jgi:hypothetical protein